MNNYVSFVLRVRCMNFFIVSSLIKLLFRFNFKLLYILKWILMDLILF